MTVLDAPHQIVQGIGRRKVFQSQMAISNKVYLIRVVVDPSESPAVIVTAYRTSKIEKYWRKT